MSILTESMYLPPVLVMKEWVLAKDIIVDKHSYYRKHTFFNTCFIPSANGWQRLTVPLKKGKNQNQAIQDVMISYDMDWPKQHLAALQTAYGKSPWWIYYSDEISTILTRKYENMLALNTEITNFLLSHLLLDIKVNYTQNYEPPQHSNDIRLKYSPKNFNTFQSLYYPQVFEDRLGFMSNASSIDLLFCQGKFGKKYLE